MDIASKKKNPNYSKLKNTDNFKDNTVNHILGGEVNKKGKAVGYHTENNLHDDLDVKLSNVTVPDEFGVYKANVTINGVKKIYTVLSFQRTGLIKKLLMKLIMLIII